MLPLQVFIRLGLITAERMTAQPLDHTRSSVCLHYAGPGSLSVYKEGDDSLDGWMDKELVYA